MGQAWRLHVHPQDSPRAAYVNRKGEVKWNLQDIEVPTVEQCVKEDALEVQDIRELGLGWAWFVNDLRAFLPAWQDMELATPSSEEPVTQIAGDVPVEPLPVQADATHLEMDIQAYERPLAVTPFGTPEIVPDWQDSHAMSLPHVLDIGFALTWDRVRTFQGLGKNGPKREQVVRRLTRDAHTRQILESLPCELHLQVPLHRRCLPGCGPDTVLPVTFRLLLSTVSCPRFCLRSLLLVGCLLPLFLRGGGGFLVLLFVLLVSVLFVSAAGSPIFASFDCWCLRGRHLWDSDIDGYA